LLLQLVSPSARSLAAGAPQARQQVPFAASRTWVARKQKFGDAARRRGSIEAAGNHHLGAIAQGAVGSPARSRSLSQIAQANRPVAVARSK